MDIKQERQLAKDETTSPDILAKLATSEDTQTRQYVANNPNTPLETLLNICFEFPKKVINNPIIPLLILENPNLLSCERVICFDFMSIRQLTDIEIKRLGWTKEHCIEHLEQNFGVRSRFYLTDEQIFSYLSILRGI